MKEPTPPKVLSYYMTRAQWMMVPPTVQTFPQTSHLIKRRVCAAMFYNVLQLNLGSMRPMPTEEFFPNRGQGSPWANQPSFSHRN